jgi:hypothetical protein
MNTFTGINGCDSVVTIITTLDTTAAPYLIASNAICNGTTYNVSFSSNAIVSSSIGTIIGSTVVGIPVGTNLILTATSVGGCLTSITTVTSPITCIPPLPCSVPKLSAGQGVCAGTGTYDVAFAATTGSTISVSAGSIIGNIVTGIPVGTNVIITASSGTCSTSMTINSPLNCNIPCASSLVSFSGGLCTGSTYDIYFANPLIATITASVGTIGTNMITGIPLGTSISILITLSGCTPQTIMISSPPPCDVTPLPVIMKSFTVDALHCQAIIKWETSQEINTSHFNVLRKRTQDANFLPLIKIVAKGNSNVNSSYSYIDLTPENGLNQYIIQSVDIDGKSEMSETRSAMLDCGDNISVFPNPANDYLMIQFNTSKDGVYQIKLTDISGRTILAYEPRIEKGVKTIKLDTSHYAAGFYHVSVTNKQLSQTFSIRIN